MKKKSVGFTLAALVSVSLFSCGKSYEEEAVVLYTNDVHCAVEQTFKSDGTAEQMGYASVASYKKETIASYGSDNVLLVDAGDHLQGDVIGSLSRGEDIVKAMNAVHYDIAIPGNHEFDFGMDHFLDLANRVAEYEYISTNFVYNGETVFNPYSIKDVGGHKIAFLGATTPDTYTSSTPKYFQDADGKYVYTFSEGEGRTGTPLYNTIQATVDKVRKEEKVDHVVLIAHLGIDGTNSPYMSTDVIKNTTGIDVVLDGHSHSTIKGDKVKNKNNEDVLLTSTGTKTQNIGKLVIDKKGNFTSELVNNYTKQNDVFATASINEIIAANNERTNEVISSTDFDLTITGSDGKRLIRKGETNLGDLIADAYQSVSSDNSFGLINGGGIRVTVPAGDITYGQIIKVQPFLNKMETYKSKGQAILDALEFSVSKIATTESIITSPEQITNEFGGYLHVSKGLKYSIDTTVDSPVVTNAEGVFQSVDSSKTRRIHNVQVATAYTDGEPTTWETLDATKEYQFSSVPYTIEDSGDGYAMFITENNRERLGKSASDVNTTVNTVAAKLDHEVDIDYIKSLGSKIPEKYKQSQGRVTYAKRS